MYVTGALTASRAARAWSRTCIRSASAVNDGRPAASSTTISPSSSVPSGRCRSAISGYAAVTTAPERANSSGWPPAEQGENADPVPLELVAPVRAGRQRARGGEHRRQRRTGHPITIGSTEHLTQASH